MSELSPQFIEALSWIIKSIPENYGSMLENLAQRTQVGLNIGKEAVNKLASKSVVNSATPMMSKGMIDPSLLNPLTAALMWVLMNPSPANQGEDEIMKQMRGEK